MNAVCTQKYNSLRGLRGVFLNFSDVCSPKFNKLLMLCNLQNQ